MDGMSHAVEMRFLPGQRVFNRSSITGDELEYFVPVPISEIDGAEIGYRQRKTRLSCAGEAFLPVASLIASRGRVIASVDVMDKARALAKLAEFWSNKTLNEKNICELHSQASGKSGMRSTYRDSMVWVDGLRPVDAKLIPGPASTLLPLMRDYIAFTRRDDIDITTKLALAHYQILMIHPFFDGNGRLSRTLALIHAWRILGASRAFAIAAMLSLHRRALGKLFAEVRDGNVRNYLAYWERLIAWSADCTAQIDEFRKKATEKISSSLAAFASPTKLMTFLIDAPLFSQSQLTTKLHLSDKLGKRYIDVLSNAAIIEPHPGSDGTRIFRCPMALAYWRQAMENTASASVALLPA